MRCKSERERQKEREISGVFFCIKSSASINSNSVAGRFLLALSLINSEIRFIYVSMQRLCANDEIINNALFSSNFFVHSQNEWWKSEREKLFFFRKMFKWCFNIHGIPFPYSQVFSQTHFIINFGFFLYEFGNSKGSVRFTWILSKIVTCIHT